jgi:cytochrome c biogenesis protein CcmG/thiol:disulfide interchange protein DsbE
MRWVVIGMAALLVGLLAYGVASQGSDTALDAAVAEGKRPPAPDASLPRLGEESTGTVDDYRGKVVLVNFWASWCPPCTDELPLLQRTQQTMNGHGATVLGINTRDAREKALAFVDRYELTFPSLRDGSGDFAEKWGLTGYPESFLLDAEGRVVALKRGPLTQGWIDEHVTPLLERS